jgi:hypothetical protein
MVLQAAAAVAYMHELQPTAVHGRLSTRTVFITSASEACVGRTISAAYPGTMDISPTPKRHHTDASTICGFSRPSSESMRSPPVAASPLAVPPPTRPRHILNAQLMACSAPDMQEVGVHTALSGSLKESGTLAWHSSGLSSAFTKQDCAENIAEGSKPWLLAAPRLYRGVSGDAALVTEKRTFGRSLSHPVLRRAVSFVSEAEMPGIGRVMRVAVPRKSAPAKDSLFEAAEASVWSRSGVPLSTTPSKDGQYHMLSGSPFASIVLPSSSS